MMENSLHQSVFLNVPESKQIFPTYTGVLDGPFTGFKEYTQFVWDDYIL